MAFVEEHHLENGTLTIITGERIDAASAPQAEAEVKAVITPDVKEILFDAKNLKYVSSSGLRLFLKLRKTMNVEIFNTSLDVYEIFSMTGFTEMMKIEKALRRVSVEGCEVLGIGAMGKVYQLTEDSVLKVFFGFSSRAMIDDEISKARIAFVHGVPSCMSFDVVECEEGLGLVLELANGKTLGKMIHDNPELFDELTEKYVNVVRDMSKNHIEDGVIPRSEEYYRSALDKWEKELDPEMIRRYKAICDAFPKGNAVIHGDLHTKNIMIQDGEPVVIDLADITAGHCIFELVGIAHSFYVMPQVVPDMCMRCYNLTPEECVKMWDRFCELYFADLPEETRKERIKAAQIMGYLFRIHTSGIYMKSATEDDSFYRELIKFMHEVIFPNVDFVMDVLSRWN